MKFLYYLLFMSISMTSLYGADNQSTNQLSKGILDKCLLKTIKNKDDKSLFEILEQSEMLLKKGADVNSYDERRRTPLHLAASSGYEQLAKLLLRKKACVNTLDIEGCSPLHYAVFYKHNRMTEILLTAKANPIQKNHREHDAYTLALSEGYHDLAKSIKSWTRSKKILQIEEWKSKAEQEYQSFEDDSTELSPIDEEQNAHSDSNQEEIIYSDVEKSSSDENPRKLFVYSPLRKLIHRLPLNDDYKERSRPRKTDELHSTRNTRRKLSSFINDTILSASSAAAGHKTNSTGIDGTVIEETTDIENQSFDESSHKELNSFFSQEWHSQIFNKYSSSEQSSHLSQEKHEQTFEECSPTELNSPSSQEKHKQAFEDCSPTQPNSPSSQEKHEQAFEECSLTESSSSSSAPEPIAIPINRLFLKAETIENYKQRLLCKD